MMRTDARRFLKEKKRRRKIEREKGFFWGGFGFYTLLFVHSFPLMVLHISDTVYIYYIYYTYFEVV